MRSDLDALIEKTVKAHNSTLRAQIQAWGPWLLFIAGVIFYLATGQHPPRVAP